MTAIVAIALDRIDEPDEAHRLAMDEQALWSLADSIRDQGLLNPIIVRPKDGERFEIVAGHRRYMAHRHLSRTEIECIIRDADYVATEDARFAENMHREQLSPMEEAVSIARYMENSGKDTKQAARALNKSEWWVNNRLALMAMPDELKELVHAEQLAAGSAIELAKVSDEQHRRYLTEFAIRSGAAVGVIREWVNQWELSKLQNPDAAAPLPELPPPGQEVIIQMPCFLCGTAHEHTKLTIVRVCTPCVKTIAETQHGD